MEHFSSLYLKLRYRTLDETWVNAAQVKDAPSDCQSIPLLHWKCLSPAFSAPSWMLHKAGQLLLGECPACYVYQKKICSRSATENRGLISRCSLQQSKNVLIDPRLFPRGQESSQHFLMNTLRVVPKTSPLGCSCFKLNIHLLVKYL